MIGGLTHVYFKAHRKLSTLLDVFSQVNVYNDYFYHLCIDANVS